jgi:hypothetical protein
VDDRLSAIGPSAQSRKGEFRDSQASLPGQIPRDSAGQREFWGYLMTSVICEPMRLHELLNKKLIARILVSSADNARPRRGAPRMSG